MRSSLVATCSSRSPTASPSGVGPFFCCAFGGWPYVSLEMIVGWVSVTDGVASSSDFVLVIAHTAIRLSVVASKSSADRKYSVPLFAWFQLPAVGDAAGCTEYARPSASGIGAPWNAWYFSEPLKSALFEMAYS